MIICITVMPGAGKSTAARILKAHGFSVIEMGAFVRRLMKEQHVRVDPNSLRSFSTELRKRHGQAAVAKFAGMAAKKEKGDVAIIGIRSPAEIHSLREQLGAGMCVIALSTPRNERYSRLEERARMDDAAMRNGLEKRDRVESGWGIREAIAMADVIISNEGTRRELTGNLTSVINSIKGAKGRR